MKNKLIRLWNLNDQFKYKLWISFALFVVLFIQFAVISAKAKQLSTVQMEKELVMTIDEMKSKLQLSPELETAAPVLAPKKKEFVLEGTTAKEGIIYALINGEIVSEGDAIDDFKIIKIAMGEAVLSNEENNEIRNLYFKQ